MEPQPARWDQLQAEIEEIAEVLLRERPPGTMMAAVWDEALTLHRVRYETEVLPMAKQVPR